MPKAQINGMELYYEVHGQGPAVVFAHGAGGNHVSWWQQVPVGTAVSLASFDHRFDSLSTSRMALVARLCPDPSASDHLGITRAALVAQSMGRTCLGSLAYPERVSALVMADTTGGF